MEFDSTAHTLTSLRDVEGVQGSFFLNEMGQLVGTDLPAVLHDDTFMEAGPRIVRLCDALEHGGEALESVSVRFAGHKLHVRRAKTGFLCVIASIEANAPALRMALALVARRLGGATTQASLPARALESPPPPSLSSSSPSLSLSSSSPSLLSAPPLGASTQPFASEPQFVSSPAPSSKPVKTYRGRTVE